MNELVQELDAVIAELKNLSPVTQILNIIDKVEALKSKVTATEPVVETPAETPVVEAPVETSVEPVVEAPVDVPVETPVEPVVPVGSVEPTV